MRKIGLIISIVVILFIFCVPASADERSNEYIEMFENTVGDKYKNLIGSDSLISEIGPDRVIFEFVGLLTGGASRTGGLFLLLLAGIMISGATSSFVQDGFTSKATLILICSSAISVMVPVIKEAARALSELQSFFALFIPVSAALSVSSGAVSTAAAQAMGMNITVAILSKVIEPLFLALSSFGLGISVIASFGDDELSSFCSGVKSFFLWAMGLCCALIMGTMSLQTVVCSAADSAKMRAAKYAAGSLIPVVGSTVSGALGTLVGGLSYAKGMIGAGGIAVAVSIFISPLITLLLYRCALSVCVGISGYLGITPCSKIYGALRQGIDLFISVYAIGAVLCVFEIALFMAGGVKG